MKPEISPTLELQIKVSKMLALGFVFSLFWIGGIGSLIAFISGLKARKIINASNGEIGGTKLMWWCIIAGALGMILFPLIIIFK